jgi:hypothetical protein
VTTRGKHAIGLEQLRIIVVHGGDELAFDDFLDESRVGSLEGLLQARLKPAGTVAAVVDRLE